MDISTIERSTIPLEDTTLPPTQSDQPEKGELNGTTYKTLNDKSYQKTLQAAAKQGVDSFGRAAGKRILEVLIVAAAITALVGTLLYTGKIQAVLNGAPIMNDTAIHMMLAGYGTLVIGIAIRACMWGTDKDAIDNKLSEIKDLRKEIALPKNMSNIDDDNFSSEHIN